LGEEAAVVVVTVVVEMVAVVVAVIVIAAAAAAVVVVAIVVVSVFVVTVGAVVGIEVVRGEDAEVVLFFGDGCCLGLRLCAAASDGHHGEEQARERCWWREAAEGC
jgi:hypothetical protein